VRAFLRVDAKGALAAAEASDARRKANAPAKVGTSFAVPKIIE